VGISYVEYYGLDKGIDIKVVITNIQIAIQNV